MWLFKQTKCYFHLTSILPTSPQHSLFVTLACPSTSSSLRITHRTFRYASPYLWTSFLRHSVNLTAPVIFLTSTSSVASPLSSSITPLSFTPILKPIFHKSFPPYSFFFTQEWHNGFWLLLVLLRFSAFSFAHYLFVVMAQCGRLSWLSAVEHTINISLLYRIIHDCQLVSH